jgi:hypothetical protein
MKRISILLALLLLPVTSFAEQVVLGNTVTICVNQTVTASAAYTAGNAVGGKITFSNAFRSGVYSGAIQDAWVTDAGNQQSTYELILFRNNPTGTTVTDKTALTIAAADLNKTAGTPVLINQVGIYASTSISGSANLGRYFKNVGAVRDVYGVLLTRNTPTFVTAGDITICIDVIQD